MQQSFQVNAIEGRPCSLTGSVALSSLWDTTPKDDLIQAIVVELMITESKDVRPNCHGVLVVDMSTSMRENERLKKVVAAVKACIEQDTSRVPEKARQFFPIMKDKDTISIVGFNASAELVMPETAFENGAQAKANYALQALQASGGTSIREGLKRALRAVQDTQHIMETQSVVVLLTDGEDGGNFKNDVKTAIARPDYEIEPTLKALMALEHATVIGVTIGGQADSRLVDDICQLARGISFYADDRDNESIADVVSRIAGVLHLGLRQRIEARVYIVLGEPQAKRPRTASPHDGSILIASRTVIADSGEKIRLHFKLPEGPEGRKAELTLRVDILVNGKVVQEVSKVIHPAAEGYTPRCYVACLVPTFRTLLSDAVRDLALALSDGKSRQVAVEGLQKARSQIKELWALALPDPAAAEGGAMEADVEDADVVVVSPGKGPAEECDDKEALAEAKAAYDECLGDIEKRLAELAAATEKEELDILKARNFSSARDMSRGGDCRESSSASRTLSECVRGMAQL